MKTLLFECGCEEIPARFMANLSAQLEKNIEKECRNHRLLDETVKSQSFATYRRLAVCVDGIRDTQIPESDKAILGPPVERAKDAEGHWTQVALGWAKKNKVSLDDVQFKDDVKGRSCLFVSKAAASPLPAQDVLPGILSQALSELSLPIAMRWGDAEGPFVRPIQWMVCLLDETPVSVEFCGIRSGNQSFGHRFLSEPGVLAGDPIPLSHPHMYQEALKQHHVMVDPEERRAVIEPFVRQNNGSAPMNEGLLHEVSYLVEYPHPLVGSFEERFLDLPTPVLEECMAKHQKYFPVYANNQCSNRFIVVADNVTDQNIATILKGNEKVLGARLDDAMFFWNEDKKQPLSAFNDGLKAVVYQKNLGTIWDKKERLKAICSALAKKVGASVDECVRAASLSKADLTTQMVYEFPSLQGIMGGKYARLSGESDVVATAITEQYYPLTEQSETPSSIAGALLAIADRIDNSIACFENGNVPTSSKDPWGIRKSMIAIASILLSPSLKPQLGKLSIQDCLDAGYDAFKAQIPQPKNKTALLTFFTVRVTHVLSKLSATHGVTPDLIDAVLDLSKPLSASLDVSQELQVLKHDQPDAFKCLFDTGLRVSRISQKSSQDVVDPFLFEDAAETKLWTALTQLNGHTPSIMELLSLSKHCEHYFNDVLVMHENPQLKNNRLAVLATFDAYFKQVFNAERCQ